MASYEYLNGTIVNQTPYRAFGWIVLKTEFPAGSHIVADWPENRQWINFWTKGEVLNISTDSSSTPPNFSLRDGFAGDWLDQDYLNQCHGIGSFDCVQDSVLWCISDDLNDSNMPSVEKWELNAGQSSQLPVGTRLFVCQGSVQIDGVDKTEPFCIHVKNNPLTVTANEQSYAFKFL